MRSLKLFNCALTSFFLAVVLTACATASPKGADIGPRLDPAKYASILKVNTISEKKYDGFYQLYEAHVTFIDSEVQTAILQRKSDVYQWNQEMAQKEREKMFQENSNTTKFVMVFFSPRTRFTDLHKKSSVWKVYLDVNGQRYESEIKKVQGPYDAIQAIYPAHNRFSTTYEVEFKIPSSAVESADAAFILTSTLGTTQFNFHKK